jgi:membrane protein DedA with SNARE-associated domain
MLGRYLFAHYGGSIVFFGRFIALLRAYAAVLAGANNLAPWRFLVFNALGAARRERRRGQAVSAPDSVIGLKV